jgi:hypothetical protein
MRWFLFMVDRGIRPSHAYIMADVYTLGRFGMKFVSEKADEDDALRLEMRIREVCVCSVCSSACRCTSLALAALP